MIQPPTETRPVLSACGGLMALKDDTPRAEYRGQAVYFCHAGCLRAFLQDPDGFMAGDVDHPDSEW